MHLLAHRRELTEEGGDGNLKSKSALPSPPLLFYITTETGEEIQGHYYNFIP